MKITFKLPGDSTVYTYNGNWESFNAIYPQAGVLTKESVPMWDEELQTYI